jgi:hypothetical protein
MAHPRKAVDNGAFSNVSVFKSKEMKMTMWVFAGNPGILRVNVKADGLKRTCVGKHCSLTLLIGLVLLWRVMLY